MRNSMFFQWFKLNKENKSARVVPNPTSIREDSNEVRCRDGWWTIMYSIVRKHQQHDLLLFFLLFLQPSKTNLLASRTNVEMLGNTSAARQILARCTCGDLRQLL